MAAAAAMMKADVNFLGAIDEQTGRWLEERHVFLRDAWETGDVTVRRLQRLYHRLFPGDLLILDGTLPDPLTVRAAAYARERGARVLIGLAATSRREDAHARKARATDARTDEAAIPKAVGDGADLLVFHASVSWSGQPREAIGLADGDNLEAWVGAMALCLMNGLDLERSREFCRRAAGFADLPWYDEVAYG